MKNSLQGRLVTAITVLLVGGAVTSGYIYAKFRAYERDASDAMSGTQKHVILGQVLEARIKAAQELVASAGTSQEARDAFKKKIDSIITDLGEIKSVRPDKSLDEIKSLLVWVGEGSADTEDQLFTQYRNVNTTLFNLYRTCWANKWMNVAKTLGLALNDMDNAPYHSATRAMTAVTAKIGQLVGVITGSDLSQESKLYLMGQLNTLKTQIQRYSETMEGFEKYRSKRLDDLRKADGLISRFNQDQSRTMSQFAAERHVELLKALGALSLFGLFALFWAMIASGRFKKHIKEVVGHLSNEMTTWVSRGGGAIASHGFNLPAKPDLEFEAAYQTIDETMRRINTLRREEALIKRLLAVPLLLVGSTKQAVFWNSALMLLVKTKSVEESGASPYTNLVRFTDFDGHPVDPIDKALTSKEECSWQGLLRAGEESVPVDVRCSLATGSGSVEYVMVHIRDLRDDLQKSEKELARQIDCVKNAIETLKGGGIPNATPVTQEGAFPIQAPALECLAILKEFALDLHEKATVVTGQAETMGTRMAREAGLKKAVHGRMEQVRDEVTALRAQLAELRKHSETMGRQMAEIENRSRMLKKEYGEIRHQGSALQEHLKTNERLIGVSLEQLSKTEKSLAEVRESERVIRAVIDKSHVLNANNSILGSRRELKPADVVAITENVSQLMSQFERGYRLIEQSTGQIEKALSDISGNLRENLSTSAKLTENDISIVKSVQHSERLVDAEVDDFSELLSAAHALQRTASQVTERIVGVERKLQSLAQIGQASLELQFQLERGFQGIVGQVDALSNKHAPTRPN